MRLISHSFRPSGLKVLQPPSLSPTRYKDNPFHLPHCDRSSNIVNLLIMQFCPPPQILFISRFPNPWIYFLATTKPEAGGPSLVTCPTLLNEKLSATLHTWRPSPTSVTR